MVDEEVAKEIVMILNSQTDIAVKINTAISVHDKITLIAESILVVSARLHPFMIAKLIGVPCVGYNYAGKVAAFNQALSKSSVLDPALLHSVSYIEDVLLSEASSPSFCSKIEMAKRKASCNFNFINELKEFEVL